MRAAPAVSVRLLPSTHWRRALALLALAALTSTATWAWQRGDRTGVLALGGVLAGVALAVRTARPGPRQLRWDGQRWWLQTAPEPAEPLAGEVSVAIDLGAWLLLRFDAAPGARPRRAWLPLQRAGQEPDWHALRCALYSPRPAATDPSP